MATENNPGGTDNDRIYLTRAEVEEVIDQRLGALRIYVSEADISQAQESIRAIVEQAEF